jgi:hypothetical protein
MPVTPKRLFGPALLTNATATKYTVPAATKTKIRHMHVSNPGAAVTMTISIGADAAGTRIYDVFPIPATTAIDLWCYYVLEAAEILAAFASVTNQITLTINGDESTLG